jgi:hypothetical protein
MNKQELAQYIRSQVEEMEEIYNAIPNEVHKRYLSISIETYLDIYNKMFSAELDSDDYAWAKERLADYDTAYE